MFSDILLAVDLTSPETQRKAVAAAVGQAKAFGSRLHVVTVVPEFNSGIVAGFFPKDFEGKALEATREQLHAYCEKMIPADVKLQHVVAHGTIYQEIVKAAQRTNCDLIIMASHRPELSDFLLGPNAARVVRHAACSVMIIRD
ncbi:MULTISPECIES: universal stress protein [Thalassobaculum]|uniref:Nucleotide-binding universal stress protein, UspA family n=1 Tax=Thalassobaculum litoreum DSM 18839 TaxID=1123362 RepID=A0A8G2EVT4_9PROT|nr:MULTISPECIES: universal stress protein [Thalassobaculum]SDF43786.1 Nucleotide-binding universal stress protein, UspA family [Thalassobaculum litoreum DSM 18839]